MKPTPEMIEAAARTLYYQEEYADLGQIRSASWDELSQTNRNIFIKRARLPLQAALAAMWSDDMVSAPRDEDGPDLWGWSKDEGKPYLMYWDGSGWEASVTLWACTELGDPRYPTHWAYIIQPPESP